MTDYLSFAVAAAVILVIVILVWRYQKKNGGAFDERQALLRGNAYKRAFFAVTIYCVLHALIVLFSEKPVMEDGVGMMMAMFVGVTVFALDCIHHDAFFTAKQTPGGYILLLAVNIVTQGVGTAAKIRNGAFLRNGVLTMACVQPACLAVFTVILIALLVRRYGGSRAEAEE
ncbi:MAG: hypothetical protein IJ766_07430 [Clostridia bacterium]|nr:hypothetical protein [Clostridia bacterium]